MGIPERWKRFRELPPDIDQSLGHLTPFFERNGVLLAYLFGSKSKGGTVQDIDLAILTRDRPVFRLREAITEFLGTEVRNLPEVFVINPLYRL